MAARGLPKPNNLLPPTTTAEELYHDRPYYPLSARHQNNRGKVKNAQGESLGKVEDLMVNLLSIRVTLVGVEERTISNRHLNQPDTLKELTNHGLVYYRYAK